MHWQISNIFASIARAPNKCNAICQCCLKLEVRHWGVSRRQPLKASFSHLISSMCRACRRTCRQHRSAPSQPSPMTRRTSSHLTLAAVVVVFLSFGSEPAHQVHVEATGPLSTTPGIGTIGTTCTRIGFATPRSHVSLPRQPLCSAIVDRKCLYASNNKADKDIDASNDRRSSSKKTIVGLTALSSYTATTLTAKLQILPGPPGVGGTTLAPYTDALIARDLGVSLLCAVLGLAFVKAITTLASKEILEPRDSRKIIHTLSAPLFMVFWPLFSDSGGARVFAGIVPLANAVRLYVAATGSGDEEELASAVSRSGDAKEALGGPFFYVLVLLASVLVFWRDGYAGIIASSTMAAGDGLADLIGRRFGENNKWFFNKDKSIAGSVAFFIGASSCSIAIAWWFAYTGTLVPTMEFADVAVRIVIISAISAIVELIPIVDDNWSVPLTAAILAAALLQ